MTEQPQPYFESNNRTFFNLSMKFTPEEMYLTLTALRKTSQDKLIDAYQQTQLPIIRPFQAENFNDIVMMQAVMPEFARPMARELVANIYTDKKYTALEREKPLRPDLKCNYYAEIHAAGLVSLDEVVHDEGEEGRKITFRDAWREAVATIENPFQQAGYAIDFARHTLSGDEQKNAISQTADHVAQMVDEIILPEETLTWQSIHGMKDLTQTMKQEGRPEVSQKITNYVRSLYDTGIIHAMSPWFVEYTFPILDSNLDSKTTISYMDRALSVAKYRMKNSFSRLVTTMTRGAMHVDADDIISDKNTVRVVDSHGKVVYTGLCDIEALQIAFDIASIAHTYDKEEEATKEYDSQTIFYTDSAVNASEILLKHDRVDKTFALWDSVPASTFRHTFIMMLLHKHALKKNDMQLFQEVSDKYVEKSAPQDYPEEDLHYGVVSYISESIRSRKVANINLIPEVRKSLTKDSLIACAFIKQAIAQLPEDHPNHQYAAELLEQKIQDAQLGELKNDQIEELLSTMFFLKTQNKPEE